MKSAKKALVASGTTSRALPCRTDEWIARGGRADQECQSRNFERMVVRGKMNGRAVCYTKGSCRGRV